MSFMEKLENNVKQSTEKGGVGYKTSGSALVDLNFAIPSFRERIDENLFAKALKENKNLTLRWLLYLRDIRHGVGERKSFKDFVRYLINTDEDLALDFIRTVPIEEYGRWDDYIDFLYLTPISVKEAVMNKIAYQWKKDLAYCDQGKPISLLAKWLKSENSSSPLSKQMGRFIRTSLGETPKSYRQKLSKLRRYLDVVEVKMSSNNWDKIDYSKVPSRANIIYSDAFYKHDSHRRMEFLDSLDSGETKINADALFLHDIVHKYRNGIGWRLCFTELDQTLESLWKAHKKTEGFKNTLVVRDGSGSMMMNISRYSELTAMDVADAITLYCAENNTGEFKNKFVTFSRDAKVVSLEGAETLLDKLKILFANDDISTTNIESVFNLILKTAVKHKMRQEDLPKNILIVSDMEIDIVRESNGEDADFELLAKKYREKGYELPKLIFWNVNSRTNTIPIQENKNGVILLSGFSTNLMNLVISSELDPYKALVKELMESRYDVVDRIC